MRANLLNLREKARGWERHKVTRGCDCNMQLLHVTRSETKCTGSDREVGPRKPVSTTWPLAQAGGAGAAALVTLCDGSAAAPGRRVRMVGTAGDAGTTLTPLGSPRAPPSIHLQAPRPAKAISNLLGRHLPVGTQPSPAPQTGLRRGLSKLQHTGHSGLAGTRRQETGGTDAPRSSTRGSGALGSGERPRAHGDRAEGDGPESQTESRKRENGPPVPRDRRPSLARGPRPRRLCFSAAGIAERADRPDRRVQSRGDRGSEGGRLRRFRRWWLSAPETAPSPQDTVLNGAHRAPAPRTARASSRTRPAPPLPRAPRPPHAARAPRPLATHCRTAAASPGGGFQSHGGRRAARPTHSRTGASWPHHGKWL